MSKSPIGIFGSIFDRRQGQPQSYSDGTPVHEGDKVTHYQDVGGLLPASTTTGIASFCSWGNAGELYVRYGPYSYAHMNGRVERSTV